MNAPISAIQREPFTGCFLACDPEDGDALATESPRHQQARMPRGNLYIRVCEERRYRAQMISQCCERLVRVAEDRAGSACSSRALAWSADR
jgi:hypothetical protein